MHSRLKTCRFAFGLCLLALAGHALRAEEAPPRTDYLSFAQGAVPVSATTFGTPKGIRDDLVMACIDGNATAQSMVGKVQPDGGTELVFVLPSPTQFDRFGVPNILETPSPSQTFFKNVEIHGAVDGADGPWRLLGSAVLSAHAGKGEVTWFAAEAGPAVRWVKLRLSGGLDLASDLMFFEFSEIIGNGSQEAPPLSTAFDGVWSGRGVLVELHQDGVMVSGCVDKDGEPFEGVVSGKILRGRSTDLKSDVESLFILTVTEDDELQGVRSSNGGPFHHFRGGPAKEGTRTTCSAAPPSRLGCASVIHGIEFDYNSAVLRPESSAILEKLAAGLKAESAAAIRIEGHASSEGSADYNLGLSQRRAKSVVEDLARRGIPAERLAAVGRGEASPIASNASESGRALNRRVEVHCEQ